MKRHEKRQAQREANKKKDPIIENARKYIPLITEFHKQEKGSCLDWLVSLSREELLSWQEVPEEKMNAWKMYIACKAYCLHTGNNEIYDPNPDTDDSIMVKIYNHFQFLLSMAELIKAGYVKCKQVGNGFFDLDEQFQVRDLKSGMLPRCAMMYNQK